MSRRDRDIVIRGDRRALARIYLSESDKDIELDRSVMSAIALGLSGGLSEEDACGAARVPPHKFSEWYGAGKALAESGNHPSIPELLPRQAKENEEEYKVRLEAWKAECDLLYDFFIVCNESKQEINKSMLTVMRLYAEEGNIDSWKAARELVKMRGGAAYNQDQKIVQQHEHIVSGEVKHTHTQQVQSLMENLLSIAGTALPEDERPIVIDAEIIDDTASK